MTGSDKEVAPVASRALVRLEPNPVPIRAHFDQLPVPRTPLSSPASLPPGASFTLQPTSLSCPWAANRDSITEHKSVKPLSQVLSPSCHPFFVICFNSC